MKQRITIEQLQELTVEQQQRLREWWEPEEGDWYTDDNEELLIVDHMRECCQGDYCYHLHSTKGISIPDLSSEQAFNRDIEAIKLGKALPLLSIGQMIELLMYEHRRDIAIIDISMSCKSGLTLITHQWDDEGYNPICIGESYELCDALWQAVKQVL